MVNLHAHLLTECVLWGLSLECQFVGDGLPNTSRQPRTLVRAQIRTSLKALDRSITSQPLLRYQSWPTIPWHLTPARSEAPLRQSASRQRKETTPGAVPRAALRPSPSLIIWKTTQRIRSNLSAKVPITPHHSFDVQVKTNER
jgi:hypothetical protein